MIAEPNTVHSARVEAALGMLGVNNDAKDLMAVTITPQSLVVTRVRLNEEGRPFPAGKEVATVTTVVAIDYLRNTTDRD